MEKRKVNFEVRDKGRIEGYVLKYDTISDVGHGMYEKFEKNSIEIDDRAEAYFNHDSNMLLGRAGANLTFEQRDDGLMYKLELPDTTLGKDVRELLDKKIITGASLGFIPDKEKWDGDVRVIEKATLKELSLVSSPAYESSSAYLRSLKKKAKQHFWGKLILDV